MNRRYLIIIQIHLLYTLLFVGIIIFALAGKISDSFRFLENHLLKWQDSFKA
ncbi:hypothetical protein [Peribacillus sp. NPDC096540]|uniref:hypothetical protein n=1 Tax=Peribacillus sp. NPDC096540 TaxID=3390612 RepID=UPI003D03D06C